MNLKTPLIVIVILAVFAAYLGMFTVTQGQKALLLRLGKIVQNPKTKEAKVFNPGLHFKIPFVNQVRKFDVRLQTLTVQSSRIITEEQKFVLVDYYVKWKINDLPLYFTRTGGFAMRAENLLQQQVNDALRAAFGKRTITEVVSGERLNVMRMLKQRANQTAQGLGIAVVDVRIKSIDLPKEVSDSVFSRMRADREQVAMKHRADGRAQAEKIKATAEAQATITVAQANTKAAKIRADGITKAAKIYADTYNKDPKFYAFYRSLKAYKQSFNNRSDFLVLRPDSQFFKYFLALSGKSAKFVKPNVEPPQPGNSS